MAEPILVAAERPSPLDAVQRLVDALAVGEHDARAEATGDAQADPLILSLNKLAGRLEYQAVFHAESERILQQKSDALVHAVTKADAEKQRLDELRGQLERTVRDRSAELVAANLQLTQSVETAEAATRGLEISEADLKRKTRKLEASNRELEQFAAVAAHDLQEPLRKIRAFSSRIQENHGKDLPPSGQADFTRVTEAAERMSTLIADLLKFARVESRARDFAKTDLNEVLRGVLSDMEVDVEEAGASICVGGLPMVWADATQMRQLFQNLLSNGLKFVRAGCPPVVEVLEASSTGGSSSMVSGVLRRSCEIEVRDHGIGFEEEYSEKIFAVFQRLHGRKAYAGTGIGLAICRKIVERHGGEITARSSPGEGATFVVRLPLE